MKAISCIVCIFVASFMSPVAARRNSLVNLDPINSCPAEFTKYQDIAISPQLKDHLSSLHPQSIHVLSNDDGSAYLTWQSRIQYHTFLRNRSPFMTVFTRLMHRKDRSQRNWAAHCEVPTVQIEPSDWRCESPDGCPYVPKERIFTTMKFLQYASEQQPDLIKGQWLLIVDPDIYFRGPVVAGNASDSHISARGGQFRYMDPLDETVNPIMQNLFQLSEDEANSINPVAMNTCLMRVEDMYRALQLAWDYQLRTLHDTDAEALGWIKEMWSFSAAITKLQIPLTVDPVMMHDNPFCFEDTCPDEAPLLHASYHLELIYKDDPDRVLWKYIKNDFEDEMYWHHLPQLPPLNIHTLNSTRFPVFKILLENDYDDNATDSALPSTTWMLDTFNRAKKELVVGGQWDCVNCQSNILYIAANPSELYV